MGDLSAEIFLPQDNFRPSLHFCSCKFLSFFFTVTSRQYRALAATTDHRWELSSTISSQRFLNLGVTPISSPSPLSFLLISDSTCFGTTRSSPLNTSSSPSLSPKSTWSEPLSVLMLLTKLLPREIKLELLPVLEKSESLFTLKWPLPELRGLSFARKSDSAFKDPSLLVLFLEPRLDTFPPGNSFSTSKSRGSSYDVTVSSRLSKLFVLWTAWEWFIFSTCAPDESSLFSRWDSPETVLPLLLLSFRPDFITISEDDLLRCETFRFFSPGFRDILVNSCGAVDATVVLFSELEIVIEISGCCWVKGFSSPCWRTEIDSSVTCPSPFSSPEFSLVLG